MQFKLPSIGQKQIRSRTGLSSSSPASSSFALSRNGSRLLPWLDWKFSLLVPVALLLLAVALLADIGISEPLYTITVRDGETQSALANAEIVVGSTMYRTDADGRISVDRPDTQTTISINVPGYRASSYAVPKDDAQSRDVTLTSSAVSGSLTDGATGGPIVGAEITVFGVDGSQLGSTSTDEAGRYVLDDVPEGATLSVDAGPYGTQSMIVDDRFSGSASFARLEAEGVVTDDLGNPVQGALVQSGNARAVSGGDGRYMIEGVSNGADVVVSASGFETTTATVQDGRIADVMLTDQLIKGIYANWSLLTTPGGLDGLIEIANSTEINAIVIDVKQDTVYFDSSNAFFNDVGTVNPIMDVDAVIQTLAENDIYAIARLVVFQDPLVAEARSDLAVKDTDGGLWVNENGTAWVSAFNEELWDANIALAVEVINRGFNEVQYDYVRFPSDGDLSTAEFGVEYTAETREAAITEFMKRSHQAVNDAGGALAADLFGFVTIVDDEQYIGQRFSALEPHLDYVCMMIYPSHFSEGNIASADGHPNDFPYETISESLQRAEGNAPGSSAKFRPWLQDFSYGFNGLRDYTGEDVRAQIDAAEEFDASGWLLWGDPFNVTVDALKPEPGT